MRKFTLSVLVLLVSVFFTFGQFAKTTDPVQKIIEPFEVGGVGPVTAVRRQHMTVERVEHDHDGFHKVHPPG